MQKLRGKENPSGVFSRLKLEGKKNTMKNAIITIFGRSVKR